VSVLYIVSNTSVTTNNRLETDYTVIFRVQHMNVLYAVSRPQRQNQHTGHLFHGSPTAHIQGAQNWHTATRTTSLHRQQQQYPRGTTRPGYHTARSTAIHNHTYIVYTTCVRLDDEISTSSMH